MARSGRWLIGREGENEEELGHPKLKSPFLHHRGRGPWLFHGPLLSLSQPRFGVASQRGNLNLAGLAQDEAETVGVTHLGEGGAAGVARSRLSFAVLLFICPPARQT